MKKLALTAMVALALVLTFTQCKKETEKPTAAEEKVFVTLTATYGQSGEKTDFTPGNGSFVWSDGVEEYIFVGGSLHEGNFGVLYGTGTGTGSMGFSGYLTSMPENGETLHFFYLGKGTTEENMSTTLDFSTQDGTLAKLTNNHVAIGHTTFNGAFNFNVALSMAVSFAYFDISGFVNSSNEAETVRLYGNDVYSTATVNYQDGTITGSTKGNINLGTANAGKYVALIPSTTDLTTLEFDSNSKTGSITFLRGIQAGSYYVAQGGTALNVEATTAPVFSVSSTTTVRFAPGNLQATTTDYGANWTWAFAANQWDYIGNATANNTINGNGTVSANGTVDLFGWVGESCSASFTGAALYGISNSTVNNDYGDQKTDALKSDWGNTIGSDWRTLTSTEWAYLFTRNSGATVNETSNACYTHATINTDGTGVYGMILFPDGVTIESSEATSWGTVNDNGDYSGTQCTTAQWTALAAKGCVFLPAAGFRRGNTVTAPNTNKIVGHYWSSSPNNSDDPNYSSQCAYNLYFKTNSLTLQDINYRKYGYSVRLVKEAQ